MPSDAERCTNSTDPQVRMIKPVPFNPNASGVVIPDERSTKQKQFAFCANPECAENGEEFEWEIAHSLSPCPKCGACKPPMVGIKAKVHLMIRDRMGPFEGVGGLRYRIACDTQSKRHGISTLTNHEVGTDDRSVCNCIDCLIEANKINAPARSGIQLHT
jgi:hypothetical protein